MIAKTEILHSPASASAGRLAAFGDPPLILGERQADYDELFAKVFSAVKPADIFEHFWVDDVVGTNGTSCAGGG